MPNHAAVPVKLCPGMWPTVLIYVTSFFPKHSTAVLFQVVQVFQHSTIFKNSGPFFVSTCSLPKYTFSSLIHVIPSLLGMFSHVNQLLFSYFQASSKSSHSGKACLLGRAGSFGSDVLQHCLK